MGIICIKCLFELRDLVMFTKNVKFELVYIWQLEQFIDVSFKCRGIMLNYFIFSGN